MKVNKLVSWAVLCLCLPVLGCAKVLGIEEKRLDSSDDRTPCPLVAEQGPAVRIMNAIPGSGPLDLCHRSAGRAAYDKPWFASNSRQCGSGVSYTQFTRNLGISAGTYDFKLVPAGSSCAAEGIETANVEIGSAASITLMAYGPDASKGQISTLPNLTQATNTQPIRFVHALNNAGLLTAGMLSRAVSNTIGTALFEDVEFGHASAASKGPTSANFDDVDELGYVKLGSNMAPVGDMDFGVTQATSATVLLSAPIPLTPGHAYTVFAVGTVGVSEARARIWSCDEQAHTGLFLTCGNPKRISAEVFNPNLTDGFTPLVVERTDPAIEAILAEPTDLLCVTELYDPRLVERLRSSQSPVFDQAVFSDEIPTERITALVKTANDETPTYPEVACPPDLATDLAAWFDCAKAMPGCTTTDPDNAGHTVFSSPGEAALGCMVGCGEAVTNSMITQLQPGGRTEAGSCYWCAITHLASYDSFERTLDRCTTAVPERERRHLAFNGSTGLAVFSRNLSLGEATLVQLPSSGWQRAAMRVPVTAANGATFDFWCASVRFPNQEEVLSYAGPYGTWGTIGNAEEQAFEVMNAVAVIEEQAKATGIPAIVAIEAYSGPRHDDPATGAPLVYPFASEIYDLMGSRWPELVAADFTPACTYCGDAETNPLNGLDATFRFWTAHLFGLGIEPSNVESTVRTFTDLTATLTDPSSGIVKVPVSQFYGIRSVIQVTQ